MVIYLHTPLVRIHPGRLGCLVLENQSTDVVVFVGDGRRYAVHVDKITYSGV